MHPKSNLLSLVCVGALIASLLVSSGCVEKSPVIPKLAKIAFITQNETRPREYVVATMNEDGSGITELASWIYFIGQGDFLQCWSADRTRLIYIEGARKDPEKWLAVVDADGSNRRRLLDITDMNINGLSISPDGKTVLLAREEKRVLQTPYQGHIELETKYPNNIFKIDIESGTITPLTDFTDIQASYPVFSPNGKRIAFMGRTDDPQTHFDIYVMNADGTNVRRMTQHYGEMFYPGSVLHWSPDSRKVLYDLITVWADDSTAYLDIFILDVAKSTEVNLTNTDNISENEPRWSPDGKKIAFMSSAGVEYPNYIYVMDADGHNLKEVAARLGQPSWLPDKRRLVAAGRWEDGTLAIVNVDTENGEIKNLIPYRLIMDTYSGMQYPVWLGK